VSIGYLVYSNKRQNEIQESKRILFFDWDTGQNYAQLISTDLDGAHLQKIDLGTGSLSWSKDGRYVAIGCQDLSKVCILDPVNFFDATLYPPVVPSGPPELKQVNLPEECEAVASNKGISSVSWANDDSQLIIVCQNQEKSDVCIVDLNQVGNQCWGEKEGQDLVSRADWSPVSDSIVIDPGKKIQIVNKLGTIIKSLMDGWSPVWSPDGKEIAFVHWDDERGYAGIAIIQSDGSNFRWIYRPPKRGSDANTEYYKLTLNDASECIMGASKIAWSSDGKYLIVEASYTDDCHFAIFKIEIGTGKISIITTNVLDSPQEPSVQP
jgi:dipeptidyl aminopeptidase/acylaminoacyl peptidase